ncbi:PKD domain-containing protein [Rurimicrobium arvi]
MKRFAYLFIFIVSLLSALPTFASHIVGGEITYTCGSGGRYTIQVTIYRDCIGGSPQAISEDNPAIIAIYTTNGKLFLVDSINADNANGVAVPANFQNECVNNPPKVCLNRIVFRKTYVLDNTTTGYRVVYQRCCRNASILNIIDPASLGVNYYCIIPPTSSASCNNSAVFKNYPPQIICVNNPLVYDHSATDQDGDSLSYEFCQGYGYYSTRNDGREVPSYSGEPLPYGNGYSYMKPIIGVPPVIINPVTGLITGTPTLQGRFVVTVCCHEWRKGVLINTVTREFQFVVTNCSRAVIADMPQYSDEYNTYIVNCADYTVHFDNLSTKNVRYYWDFGVESLNNDTSDEFSPTYIYPDSGTYIAKLIVNKGSTCADSISRFVKVYPKLEAVFSPPTTVCVGDTVRFKDLSNSTYQVNRWAWNFDDFSPLDTQQNPIHIFTKGGLFNVGFAVANNKGCKDTSFAKILVDPFSPNVGNDTSIVQGETITFNGFSGSNYLWSPSKYLSDPTIANPVGTFLDTGTFIYIVTAKSEQTGCPGRDSMKVHVYSGPSLAMPNAFTPNGDGKNDRFRPIIIGYREILYFRIYNRYGQLMFESKSMDGGWDGTFHGQEQEVGVYYWLLSAKDRYGKEELIKGDVSLLR